MTTPVADFTGGNAALPFIVFAANEGGWGNEIVVQYGNFDDVANTFDLNVYLKSIPEGQTQAILTLLESWNVSRTHQLDGFGKQLFLEDKINADSDFIYVANNSAVAEVTNFDHVTTDEVIATGDGVLLAFTGNLASANTFLIGKNIQPGTVVIDTDGAGGNDIVDAGNGTLQGSGITGTINYTTGAFALAFSAPQPNGIDLEATYMYSSARQMSAGTDGGTPDLTDYVAALALIADREAYDIRLLPQPVAPELNDADTISLMQEVVRICEARKNTFPILALPSNKMEPADAYVFRRNQLNINSSFGAMYGPDLIIKDTFNDITVTVPPQGFVAGVYAETDKVLGVHMPPAGEDTGTISVVGVARKYTEAEYDLLYPENINLIMDFNSLGPTVWGQRTLLVKDSHLRDVNIRRNAIEIQEVCRKMLKSYMFKLNTDFTRLQVADRVNNYLSTVQGIVSSWVVCDTSNNTAPIIDANQLNVDIYIKFAVGIEYIQYQTVITDSGVSFQELVATGGVFS